MAYLDASVVRPRDEAPSPAHCVYGALSGVQHVVAVAQPALGVEDELPAAPAAHELPAGAIRGGCQRDGEGDTVRDAVGETVRETR
jgi:hypothetical protein